MPFLVRLRLNKWGGIAMQGRLFAALFLCSLFIAVGGDAQSPKITEKPVWTLQFLKVRPENLGQAMWYLENNWMRVRAEAKRQGAVLSYHRVSDAGMVTPDHKVWDQDSCIVDGRAVRLDTQTSTEQYTKRHA